METSWRRAAGSVLAGAVLVIGLGWTAPAVADDQVVEVRDNDFAAREVKVRSGDRVVWSWVGTNRHSATSDAGTSPLFAFDSDPDCADVEGQRTGCRSRNDPDYQDFVWTAPLVDEVTTITYHCKLHVGQNMIGTVRVRPPLEPAPSPDPSGEPSQEPTSEPDQSPDSSSPGGGGDAAEPSPSPSPSQTGQDHDAPSAGASGEGPSSTPSHGVAGRPPSSFGPPGPMPTQPLPTITPTADPAAPEVADPDLEEFPEPPSVTPSPEELGTVAVEGRDDAGVSSRAVWLGIGAMSILATAAAFAKLVLFGAPWG